MPSGQHQQKSHAAREKAKEKTKAKRRRRTPTRPKAKENPLSGSRRGKTKVERIGAQKVPGPKAHILRSEAFLRSLHLQRKHLLKQHR